MLSHTLRENISHCKPKAKGLLKKMIGIYNVYMYK